MPIYALSTKAGCERQVASGLRRMNLSRTYLPMVARTVASRRNPKKNITTISPMFRSYVFVEMETNGSHFEPIGWHMAERVRGAQRFVRFGERGPSPLPNKIIRPIVEQMDESGVIAISPHAPIDPLREQMNAGVAVDVIIREGALAGFKGEIPAALTSEALVRSIMRLDTRGKVTILLSLFGRIIHAEFEREQVDVYASDRSSQAQGQRHRRLAGLEKERRGKPPNAFNARSAPGHKS